MILAIASSATILSSCGDKTPEAPVDTVTGTQGEVIGVYVYTNEDGSGTQTFLFEENDSKKVKRPKKDKKVQKDNSTTKVAIKKDDKNKPNSADATAASAAKDDIPGKKMTVRNDSTGYTLKPRQDNTSTSRARVTFPSEPSQNSSRAAATFAAAEATKHVPVSYVTPQTKKETTKKPASSTVKQTQAQTHPETQPAYDEKVSEKSEGINIVFKTDSVEKGTTASVMIQGEPGKKYSIDFYTSPTETADYSDLADQTADENGFVTWTFDIPSSCSSGSKKIIIKEIGSNNFAQTSINIK